MGSTKTTRGGSIFWAIILIAIGVIWLLGNLGILTFVSLSVMFRLWPLALIAVGLYMLIGRGSAAIGALIGLVTVGIVLVLMFIGPSIGLAGNATINESTYDVPLADTQTAAINLELSIGETTISVLNDSPDLFRADVAHLGNLEFTTEGSSNKVITLAQADEINFNFPFASFFPGNDGPQLHWDIGLSPDVPLDLDINGGVGTADLNLSGLNLTGLDVDTGVGKFDLTLPTTAESYSATIHTGVGQMTITVPETAVTLDIESGVGQVDVDVPAGAAVRLEGDTGIGQINVPGDFTRISGDDGDRGIWQTAGFDEASEQIAITFEGGVGGLTIR